MQLKRSGFAVAAVIASSVLALGGIPTAAFADTDLESAKSTLESYSDELETATNELYQLQSDLDGIQKEIADTESEIEETENELAEAQEDLSEQIRQTYKRSASRSALGIGIILGADDFEQAVTATYYANYLTERQERAVEKVAQAQEELNQKKYDLLTKEEEQKQLVSEQEEKVEDAEEKVSEQQAYYDSLESEVQEALAADTSSSTDANTDSGDAPTGVVAVAEAQLGKSYVWAASGPNSFDCSGLAMYCYAQAGVSLPHSSQAQYNVVKNAGNLVTSVSDLSPGDLVFWGSGGSGSSIYHVGIYVGNGYYVHASTPGRGVVKDSISSASKNFVGGGSPV